jgi:hypothetical protein
MSASVLNEEIQQAFKQMPDAAKIWIYQADAILTNDQSAAITKSIDAFIPTWNSHGIMLKAEGKLFFNLFIVLCVDETEKGASGCSIDSSMRFIKETESQFNISFTNRMTLAWVENSIVLSPLQSLPATVHEGTLIFNNLVSNLGEWRVSWLTSLSKTWVRRFLVANNPILSSLK